ncbi:MAG: energy transducer TonB [Rhizonema sp. PD37]|nr:energy transducer TonB [Rhizonema sp. PD37]
MTSSSIAIKQRSKEAKALKLTLAYSLIGSLALHVAVLALGSDIFFPKESSSIEEPIEVEIIDVPKQPESKPLLEKKQQTKKEVVLRTQPKAEVHVQTSSSKVIVQKEHEVTVTAPVHKFSDNSKIPSVEQRTSQTTQKIENFQPVRQTKPVAVESSVPKFSDSKPVKTPPKEVATKPDSTPQPKEGDRSSRAQLHSAGGQGSGKLIQQLRGLRDATSFESAGNSTDSGKPSNTDHSSVAVGLGTSSGIGTRVGTGNGIGTRVGTEVGTGSGIGTRVGTGSGTGTGSGSGTGNRLGKGETVATGPSPVRIERLSGSENGRGNSSGDGNGRAACSECRAKYPEEARRRGIEGRVEVAVDTDEKGHVTNVHLAHSSGNRDLDEDTLKQARDWKLKPATGGRLGVAIATEYALEGSRRYREREERKRQREAERRNQNTTAENSNLTQSDFTHRQRLTSGTVADVPPEPRIRRHRDTPSSEESATRQAQTTLIRQLRRQSVVSDPPEKSSSARLGSHQRWQEPQRHRQSSVVTDTPSRRRRTESAASDSGSRLRASLHRQRSEESTTSSQTRLRDALHMYKQGHDLIK